MRWGGFSHEADIGVRGHGKTLDEAVADTAKGWRSALWMVERSR